MPTIDYATATPNRRISRRTLLRIAAVVVATLAFGWSLLMRPQLILSNRVLPVSNERFAVRVLVDDPLSRGEYRLYSISSFAGFHLVEWGEWHRDGRYLVVPKWAMIVVTAATLVLVLIRIRAASALPQILAKGAKAALQTRKVRYE